VPEECCNEPEYYYCDIRKECRSVHEECCNDCENFILNPDTLDVTLEDDKK
jgi:hypothetical protein